MKIRHLYIVIFVLAAGAVLWMISGNIYIIHKRNMIHFTQSSQSTHFKGADKFVIGVKTGTDVVAERVPIQILTFLQHALNVYYLSDDNSYIGHHFMTGIVKEEFDAKKLLRSDKKISRVEDTVGWDVDRHKYFPGFKFLYEKHPDKDWYVIIDDDTYVFWDELVAFLNSNKERYDPSKDLYLGLARVVKGCSNITSFEHSPNFAYGGTGVILSRPAVEKLLLKLNDCIVRYDKCFGDASVAFCLKFEVGGILLDYSIQSYMHQDMLGPLTSWPQNACRFPITLHHLKPRELQELYERDPLNVRSRRSQNATKLNYEQLFKMYNNEKEEVFEEFDTPLSGSYIKWECPSVDECKEGCRRDAVCASWSYDRYEKWCYQKKTMVKFQPKVNFTSGHIKEHYKCNY
ncbi:hypothetical protein AKO1_011592 [Acrasis kona]|uniref:Fringe-like glycosyltransferase domain-containing protein n=1 Tax=Acrasis kona TaxID=1008807 RepID=A0AAW2Z410_9EUKA